MERCIPFRRFMAGYRIRGNTSDETRRYSLNYKGCTVFCMKSKNQSCRNNSPYSFGDMPNSFLKARKKLE